MLRSNLSTRPFYNERAIRVGIGVSVLLVAALTAFNAAQILTLNQRNAEMAQRTQAAEARSRDLRGRATATRKTLNDGDVTLAQAAAREANLLIDRRAFSWTDLFNRFEETLPADVRILAVRPQVDEQGRLLVAVTVVSKRVEDQNTFIEQLEQTGSFRGLLSRQDTVGEDDLLQSVIQGYYVPPGAAEAATLPGGGSAPPSPASSNAPPRAPSGGAR